MAHPTRGHRSSTYETEELVNVNTEELTLTVRHAGAYLPQELRLTYEHTTAAQQMLLAMADSIKVCSNADAESGWESLRTIVNAMFVARVMLGVLHEAGITGFTDARIDLPLLRTLCGPPSPNTKRSAGWLLARVVRAHHSNGQAVARALANTRFQAEDSEPFTYDELTSQAIEKSARGVYVDAYAAQRELFQRLRWDVAGRTWLQVPGPEVIVWAEREYPQATALDANQSSFVAPYPEQVAWALTHPGMFGYIKSQRGPATSVRGPSMRALFRTRPIVEWSSGGIPSVKSTCFSSSRSVQR